MINLHKSMGPGRDRTRDPWICSQTRICCQTRYRLHYTRPGRRGCSFYIDLCVSMKVIGFKSARWIIFSCIFCRLLTFYRVAFSKKSFKDTIRLSNTLDPNRVQRHDQGPNCLQRKAADNKELRALWGFLTTL